jgi:acetyl esterase
MNLGPMIRSAARRGATPNRSFRPAGRRAPARTLAAILASLAVLAMSTLQAEAKVTTTHVRGVRSNIRYATHGGVGLLLDAYLPAGHGLHPAAIVIPGGKWEDVNKEAIGNVKTAQLLAGAGIVAFSVDYRPASVAPFPAQLEDVQAAVRWIRANAREFHVDPRKIGAIGASAGGHLAALLATYGRGPLDRGARINVAVSWSGPMDLVRFLRETRPDVKATVTALLGCSGGPSCAAQARAASPSNYVDSTDAPIYLANSTDEVIPLDQATEMAGLLEKVGIPHELQEVQGRNHGFGYAMSSKGFLPALSFFQRWIGGRPAGDATPSSEGASSVSQAPPGKNTEGSSAATPLKQASGTDFLLVVIAAVAAVAALGALFAAIVILRRARRIRRGSGPDAASFGSSIDTAARPERPVDEGAPRRR